VARVFNGTTDMIVADTANVYSNTAAFSVAFWIKGSAITNESCYSEGNTGNLATISLGTDLTTGAHLRYFLRSTSTTITDQSTTAPILDGVWHHAAITRDASRTMIAYIDGVQDFTHPDGTMGTGLTALGMGVLRRSSNSNFFAGNLAEIANWSRVLSTTEISQLAGGLIASLLVPDHYWPLLGVASPEPDIGTASLVNGTLTGTTSVVGPPEVNYTTFYPSLASRRPVPMIKGPDKDKLLGMRGNSY
jgi:hypothetical protein